MTLLLLGVLAFIDGTLCGFRAAAGRNPRLFLWNYYAASMRRGALVSLFTIVLFLGLGLVLRAAGGELVWASMTAAAAKLVFVYGIYATLVVAALGLDLSSSFDLGVLASGPTGRLRVTQLHPGDPSVIFDECVDRRRHPQ